MSGVIHDIVVRRLEDAGRTLMQLPEPKDGRPRGSGSAWPDVLQRFQDIMAIKSEQETGEEAQSRRDAQERQHNRARITPDGTAIDRLDEVLDWLWFITDAAHRRAVAARMLMHPLSERHAYSWARIARDMNTSPRSVERWFEEGVKAIAEGLA